MNLKERNAELVQARDIQFLLTQAKKDNAVRPDAWAAVEAAHVDAQAEFERLAKISKRDRVRDPRLMELFGIIHDLQEKLRGFASSVGSLENDIRRLRSDLGGYRARDIRWLRQWRIGQERDMLPAIDVEDLAQCERWLAEVRVHASVFLAGAEAEGFVAECDAKLIRRRAELAAGRQRNADTDAYARQLQAEIDAERQRRAEGTREQLEQFRRERAAIQAQHDRDRAAAKIEASLAFDRRVARKEVRRHAWMAKRWQKIARARDDAEFRTEWLAEVFAKSTERGRRLERVFRSAGDSDSALRASEQFQLISDKWARIVDLLDADPALTSDEAEAIVDPEYQEQREELKEIDEERLAAHNEAQAMR